MNVIEIGIDDLKTDGHNPNKVSKEQEQALLESIKKFGFLVPVIVDKDNVIADGEHRVESLRKLGMNSIPCIRLESLTEAERKLLRQVLNKVKGSHDWDLDIEELKRIMQEMSKEDVLKYLPDDAELIQETNALLNPLQETFNIDQAIQRPPKYNIEPETIWILGKHKLMCGDSMKEEHIKKLMGDMKADCMFTDPPYDVAGSSTGLKELADNHLIKPFFEQFIKNSVQFIKSVSHVYICCDWRTYPLIFGIGTRYMSIKNLIVWDKLNGGMGSNYMNQHELLAFFHNYKQQKSMQFGREGLSPLRQVRGKTNVWRIIRDSFKGTETGEREHFAKKPTELITQAILNSTEENELVLDIFGGSGSTIIACEQTNRSCYMMEIDPLYCSVIIERFENLTGKKAEQVTE